MHTALRFAAVFALLIFAAELQATDPPPSGAIFHDWAVIGTGKTMMSGQRYTLYNFSKEATLKYGHQDKGINLTWDQSKTLGNVRIAIPGRYVPGGPGREIKYGDRVAIQIDNGGWFGKTSPNYQSGVVFDAWSKTPAYTFEIFGGKKGTPVPVGRSFGLKPAGLPWQLVAETAYTGSSLSWRTVVPGRGIIGY